MNQQIRTYAPLFGIISLIVVLTLGTSWYQGFNDQSLMFNFMGFFFLIFGAFKLINLANFAQAYREYDLLAKVVPGYAYLYPVIELVLAAFYLMHTQAAMLHACTLVLMVINALGVFLELQKNRTIVCACLGAVFKVPMTYVSLAEDLLMAVMAAFMLLRG